MRNDKRMGARVLVGAASVMAVVGVLWATVAPVYACSCALPLTDDTARQVLEASDLVITGAVAETAREEVVMSVERVYDGESGESVTVAQPEGFDGEYGNPGDLFGAEIGADCSYAVTGAVGERYLLVLQESAGGEYEAQGCTSMALKLTQTDDYYEASFAAIERVAGPGVVPQVPEEGDDGGSVWVPVAVGTGIVVGLAAAGLLLWRRPLRR
jgi:hypothetical protein